MTETNENFKEGKTDEELLTHKFENTKAKFSFKSLYPAVPELVEQEIGTSVYYEIPNSPDMLGNLINYGKRKKVRLGVTVVNSFPIKPAKGEVAVVSKLVKVTVLGK